MPEVEKDAVVAPSLATEAAGTPAQKQSTTMAKAGAKVFTSELSPLPTRSALKMVGALPS
ncbi:MAG: hypothetical protein ACYDCK_13600 [Thermoplasmatota archaeon]